MTKIRTIILALMVLGSLGGFEHGQFGLLGCLVRVAVFSGLTYLSAVNE